MALNQALSAFLKKVFKEEEIIPVSKMPHIWTSVDTRNALVASLVPAGLGVASVLSARPHHSYFRFLEVCTIKFGLYVE